MTVDQADKHEANREGIKLVKSQNAASQQSISTLASETETKQPSQVSQPATAYPERRKAPRTWETPPEPVPAPHFDDYRPIVGDAEINELRFLARPLKGKTLKMVNSTAVGGGVAEMLNRLVPMLAELEVTTHWDVITGGNDFFEVTKAFHNALHGTEYQLNRAAQEIFLAYNEQNRQRMQFQEDVVVIHDPQPAGLIRSKKDSPGRWVWRCHIDLSNPNPQVWGFLRPINSMPRFFHRNHSPGNCPSRNTCFIPASILCQRRTKNSTIVTCSRSAMNSASTARVPSSLRCPVSIA
jgi:hypothetical protein